jgi:iron complex transport system ATP-binding protein
VTLSADAVSLALGGRPVLREISLAIQPARVSAILGANGAGKSSLLRVLAGLVPPESGQVSLCGMDMSTVSPKNRAQRIGYLAQEATPAWNITAHELVRLGRLPHLPAFGALSQADISAVEAALLATDMTALADREIDAMSGGERARAKFARVLAGEPDWILADEPLANLDPPHQRDMLALLKASAKDGKGIVVVLHQINAALRVADDIILMRKGTILASGPVEEVLTPENLHACFGMRFKVISDGSISAIVPA